MLSPEGIELDEVEGVKPEGVGVEEPEDEKKRKLFRILAIFAIVFVLVLILIIVLVVTLAPCTSTAKEAANAKSGKISDYMERVVVEPRSNYESKLENLGLMYHDEPTIEWSICDEDRYWNEEGMIRIKGRAEK